MSNPRGEAPSPGRPGAMSPVSDGSFRKRETPPPGRPGAMSPVNDGSFRKLSSSPKLGATAGETAPSTSSPLGSRRDGAPTDFLYQLEAAEARDSQQLKPVSVNVVVDGGGGWWGPKRKSTPPAPSATRADGRLVADDGDWFVVKLPKPMGVDVDARNALLRLAPGGAADRDRTLSIGDELIYLDGNEVRNRCSTLAAAMDGARELHTVVARRPPPPGGRAARRASGAGGAPAAPLRFAIWLTPVGGSLGLSLDDANVVVEVHAEGAAAAEGRVRVGDELLCVDGEDVAGGSRRVVDALDRRRARHELLVQRSAAPRRASRG